MKPFAYGFAAFDAETCPQPGDAKIFQLLLDLSLIHISEPTRRS